MIRSATSWSWSTCLGAPTPPIPPLTRPTIKRDTEFARPSAGSENGQPGSAYNIVDDQPATWREVNTAMAAAVGAPAPHRLPRWAFRLAAPYVATFAVDTSMIVSNAKAKADLGWKPEFASYRDGLAALSH
jgi:nucleoside-diphosphate-sugar epimerase